MLLNSLPRPTLLQCLLMVALGVGLTVPSASQSVNWAAVREGWTQIFRDVHQGKASAVTATLQSGASPHVTDSLGNTPLHYAAMTGRVDIIRQLLIHGANPNTVNGAGLSPVHYAASGFGDSGEAMAALLLGGGNPNHAGNGVGAISPLMRAKLNGNDKVIAELERRGGVFGSSRKEAKIIPTIAARQAFNKKMKALREELKSNRTMPVSEVEMRIKNAVKAWQAADPTMPDELAEEIARRTVQAALSALNRSTSRGRGKG